MPSLPLFGTASGGKSVTVTAQQRLNCYYEPVADSKDQFAIYGTPGLALFTDLGGFPTRGMRPVNDTLYVVNGQYLYGINNGGVATILGTLATAAGMVSMSDNGAQLLIVDGAGGYIYNFTTSVFGPITAPGFPANPSSAAFLNGYFVVNSDGTGRFYWSSLYDGTAWSSLDFATAESSPDALIAIWTQAGQLVLLGEVTTEFWSASGDTAIWRRVGGAGIEWGLVSPWTVAKFAGGLAFLAKNQQGQVQVVVLSGYTVTPISDPPTAHVINENQPTGAIGFAYILDGHPFYQISAGTISRLYDGRTQIWSELESDNGRHWGQVRAEFLTVPYVSDYRNGNIYRVDSAVYTDNGTPIIRQLQSRHVLTGYDRLVCWEVMVDMQPGVGLTTGQGSDPQAMLQVSRDGGNTWSFERWTTMGRGGKTLTRILWQMLGEARDWVFRFRVADPVKFVVAGASMRVGP